MLDNEQCKYQIKIFRKSGIELVIGNVDYYFDKYIKSF